MGILLFLRVGLVGLILKRVWIFGILLMTSIGTQQWPPNFGEAVQLRQKLTSERPKGVIGQWYTLASDFYLGGLVFKEAGYTWQCQEIDDDYGEPTIGGIGIGYKESYRLATPEEIAAAQAPAIEFEKPENPEEYDFVNPKHYQEFSVEVIDMMAAIWGKEATATHCEMCAFKYKLRAGSKPDQPIERDLEKAAWYLSKAKELRDA